MPSKYYAVARGRTPGIYDNWAAAYAQVYRFQGALHLSFASRAEAEAFLEHAAAALPEEGVPPEAEAIAALRVAVTGPTAPTVTFDEGGFRLAATAEAANLLLRLSLFGLSLTEEVRQQAEQLLA